MGTINQKYLDLVAKNDALSRQIDELREKVNNTHGEESFTFYNQIEGLFDELKEVNEKISSFTTKYFDDTQKYQLERSYEISNLIDFANKAIKEGWKLISVCYSSRKIDYYGVFENLNYGLDET